MSDVLVTQLVDAIADAERRGRFGAPPVGYFACDKTYLPSEVHTVYHQDALTERDAVLRRCAADRRRLERHVPTEPGIGHFGSSRFKGTDARICAHCSHDGDWGATVWPCPDVVDLADSYGLEVAR